MNEIHFRRSETQFHTKKFVSNMPKHIFGKIQFHIGEKYSHESEIEIRSRDLDFNLVTARSRSGMVVVDD